MSSRFTFFWLAVILCSGIQANSSTCYVDEECHGLIGHSYSCVNSSCQNHSIFEVNAWNLVLGITLVVGSGAFRVMGFSVLPLVTFILVVFMGFRLSESIALAVASQLPSSIFSGLLILTQRKAAQTNLLLLDLPITTSVIAFLLAGTLLGVAMKEWMSQVQRLACFSIALIYFAIRISRNLHSYANSSLTTKPIELALIGKPHDEPSQPYSIVLSEPNLANLSSIEEVFRGSTANLLRINQRFFIVWLGVIVITFGAVVLSPWSILGLISRLVSGIFLILLGFSYFQLKENNPQTSFDISSIDPRDFALRNFLAGVLEGFIGMGPELLVAPSVFDLGYSFTEAAAVSSVSEVLALSSCSLQFALVGEFTFGAVALLSALFIPSIFVARSMVPRLKDNVEAQEHLQTFLIGIICLSAVFVPIFIFYRF